MSPRPPKLPAACHQCGVILGDSERTYCDDCLPEIRKEHSTTFALAGPAALAQRRAEGTDPAHGGDAGKSRGRRNAKHQAAAAAWEHADAEKPEPDQFTCDILPLLQDIPLSTMEGDRTNRGLLFVRASRIESTASPAVGGAREVG
jgi:hypothetical protein